MDAAGALVSLTYRIVSGIVEFFGWKFPFDGGKCDSRRGLSN